MPVRSFFRSFLLASPLMVLLSTAVAAHQVQIAADVGATLHIEPHDVAQAGADTEVWFALTQAGGRVIPLAQCDCQLTLYDQQNRVVETPALTAISADGFDNIPGAMVTFPEVGAYDLVLLGSPQTSGQFTPFELSFEVTVASRTSTQAENSDNLTTSSTDVAATTDADPSDADDSATPSSAANSAETAEQRREPSAPVSTSNERMPALLLGSVILGVGLIIAIMSGRRSPGGKA